MPEHFGTDQAEFKEINSKDRSDQRVQFSEVSEETRPRTFSFIIGDDLEPDQNNNFPLQDDG